MHASKMNHGSEWEVTKGGREKIVTYSPTLATWTTQIPISQHTHALPARGHFWLPLPSAQLKEMNSLSLLYLLTAMVVIFGDPGSL